MRNLLSSLKVLQEEQVKAAQIKMAQAGIRRKEWAVAVIFGRLVLPIIIGGKMVATVNILHEEGYYTPTRVEQVKALLTLPAIATMAVVRQMG